MVKRTQANAIVLKIRAAFRVSLALVANISAALHAKCAKGKKIRYPTVVPMKEAESTKSPPKTKKQDDLEIPAPDSKISSAKRPILSQRESGFSFK